MTDQLEPQAQQPPQESETGDNAAPPPEDEGDGQHARRRRRIEELKTELVGGDLFSAAEVAEILDIHPRTVNEYVREGKLKAIQMGGGWKISERALRAFVRDQTQDQVQQRQLDATAPVSSMNPAAEPERAKRSAKYKCSFCGKPQNQVRRLIAGPSYVYICNECIALCNDILAKETKAEAP